ncbi:MAG: prolyl-tRNA synthetase associated domain-containing protein [Clostridia bacterium]|nr:prolyl-tRNA synthetase associated domain-containing protein [Clostridia bacterium]
MYKIITGRPTDKREEKEERIYDFLDAIGVSYERVDHEALFTIEACQKVDEILGFEICKNLFLVNSNKSQFYLLLMMPNKNLSTKDLKVQINSSRLSFGTADLLLQTLNLTAGSVNVCSLLYDIDNKVKLLIDEDILKQEYFGFHPMLNTSTLKVNTHDFVDTIIPALKHEPTIVKIP